MAKTTRKVTIGGRLAPYVDYKDKIREGDCIVFQCLVNTFDFHRLGGAGAAYTGHFQKWEVTSVSDSYIMVKDLADRKNSPMCLVKKDIKENDDGTATFQIGPNFHIIEPMIFAVWVAVD